MWTTPLWGVARRKCSAPSSVYSCPGNNGGLVPGPSADTKILGRSSPLCKVEEHSRPSIATVPWIQPTAEGWLCPVLQPGAEGGCSRTGYSHLDVDLRRPDSSEDPAQGGTEGTHCGGVGTGLLGMAMTAWPWLALALLWYMGQCLRRAPRAPRPESDTVEQWKDTGVGTRRPEFESWFCHWLMSFASWANPLTSGPHL